MNARTRHRTTLMFVRLVRRLVTLERKKSVNPTGITGTLRTALVRKLRGPVLTSPIAALATPGTLKHANASLLLVPYCWMCPEMVLI